MDNPLALQSLPGWGDGLVFDSNLQRTPSETDPALSKEDQVRRMFAPELEMEVRDKLCANIYGEDQLWEDLQQRLTLLSRHQLHVGLLGVHDHP